MMLHPGFGVVAIATMSNAALAGCQARGAIEARESGSISR